MTTPPTTAHLFYWNLKTPTDNLWHPLPGGSPTKHLTTAPQWTTRLDLAATVVDAFPLIATAGTLTHLRQLPHLGLTTSFSPLHNPLTLRALHVSALITVPGILLAQAVGLEYRYFIPRWAHERERGRDEEQARRHVEAGMWVGAGVMVARRLGGLGPRWSLVDLVLGGALADVALREYGRAHGAEG